MINIIIVIIIIIFIIIVILIIIIQGEASLWLGVSVVGPLVGLS